LTCGRESEQEYCSYTCFLDRPSNDEISLKKLTAALVKARMILDGEYPDTDDRHPSQWLDKILEEAGVSYLQGES
jgi:uncharacterized iron-regulated protein